MIEGGLEDVSFTRASVSWGVPVPWEPDQTIYVWVDALLNYRTALDTGWAATYPACSGRSRCT